MFFFGVGARARPWLVVPMVVLSNWECVYALNVGRDQC